MEHETQKIKELDEQYSNELREWKAMLVPRKQVTLCWGRGEIEGRGGGWWVMRPRRLRSQMNNNQMNSGNGRPC